MGGRDRDGSPESAARNGAGGRSEVGETQSRFTNGDAARTTRTRSVCDRHTGGANGDFSLGKEGSVGATWMDVRCTHYCMGGGVSCCFFPLGGMRVVRRGFSSLY